MYAEVTTATSTAAAAGSGAAAALWAADAEREFRDDLVEFPHNGWSLLGLANAMEAQPDRFSAADVGAARSDFAAAWERADFELTSPCPLLQLDLLP